MSMIKTLFAVTWLVAGIWIFGFGKSLDEAILLVPATIVAGAVGIYALVSILAFISNLLPVKKAF